MNKITVGTSIITVLLIGIALVGAVYAQTTTRSGDTVVGRIDYVEAVRPGDEACIEHTDLEPAWVVIPQMTKTFTQGGLLANEVVIDLFSEVVTVASYPDSQVKGRVVIDGTPVGTEFLLRQPQFIGEVTSRQLVSNPIAPGTHTMEFQAYLEYIEGHDRACFSTSSIVIHHR